MNFKKALLINDTSSEHHIGSKIVIQQIKKLCEQRDIKIVAFYKRSTVLNESQKMKEVFKNIDLVIVNGEGSLHNSPQWFSVLLQTLPENKPCFLINSLWEKMYVNDIGLLNKFKIISLRESFSYQEMKKNNTKHKNIRIVPDLIFNTNSDAVSIGYGDSVLQGLRTELSKKHNYFPLHTEATEPDINAYVNWLKSLKSFYVTGRFHGVCLSIIAEVPFLTFPSNSHKIEGILSDIECQELLIHTHEEICEERIWHDVKNYSEHFKRYKSHAKEKIKMLFDDIAKEVM